MEIVPLALKHQPLITHHLTTLKQKFPALLPSEYSFANLYLFRTIHNYQLAIGNDPYILGISRDNHRYIMPLVLPHEMRESDLSSLMEQAEWLFPIPDEWLCFFPPERIKTDFWDGDSDYICETEKIAFYPGRHLSSKRNLVHQFTSHHFVESIPLSPMNAHLAQQLLDIWQSEQDPDQETDYRSCCEALAHLQDLPSLTGSLYFADGKAVGFLVGEPLTASCYAIHFLKADRHYKGIYQYIQQNHAQQKLPHFALINLEQDMGIPSLAYAKETYLPKQHLKKWRVSQK